MVKRLKYNYKEILTANDYEYIAKSAIDYLDNKDDFVFMAFIVN